MKNAGFFNQDPSIAQFPFMERAVAVPPGCPPVVGDAKAHGQYEGFTGSRNNSVNIRAVLSLVDQFGQEQQWLVTDPRRGRRVGNQSFESTSQSSPVAAAGKHAVARSVAPNREVVARLIPVLEARGSKRYVNDSDEVVINLRAGEGITFAEISSGVRESRLMPEPQIITDVMPGVGIITIRESDGAIIIRTNEYDLSVDVLTPPGTEIRIGTIPIEQAKA